MIRYEYNDESYETYEEALDAAMECADIDDYYDGLKDYIDCNGFANLLHLLPADVLCHIQNYVNGQCEFYINTVEEPDELKENKGE